MYKVGITGGIATGKSTVANYLIKKEIPVIDCDILARRALEKGTAAYKSVINKFGSEIKLDNAEIDRKKLGNIVFNNKDQRKILERIVHEQVLRGVQSKIREYISDKKPLVFIDIPLLFEVKWEFLVDETWVVYCDEKEQLERIQKRDNLTIDEAKSRLSAQIPIQEKEEMGDIKIDSSEPFEDMYSQIEHELERLNEKLNLDM